MSHKTDQLRAQKDRVELFSFGKLDIVETTMFTHQHTDIHYFTIKGNKLETIQKLKFQVLKHGFTSLHMCLPWLLQQDCLAYRT